MRIIRCGLLISVICVFSFIAPAVAQTYPNQWRDDFNYADEAQMQAAGWIARAGAVESASPISPLLLGMGAIVAIGVVGAVVYYFVKHKPGEAAQRPMVGGGKPIETGGERVEDTTSRTEVPLAQRPDFLLKAEQNKYVELWQTRQYYSARLETANTQREQIQKELQQTQSAEISEQEKLLRIQNLQEQLLKITAERDKILILLNQCTSDLGNCETQIKQLCAQLNFDPVKVLSQTLEMAQNGTFIR